VCEDFRQSDITDDNFVSLAPAGHVHLQICSEQYYLAAIAEDSWFENEQKAKRIADRIGDTRSHYGTGTVLDNAEDMLEELEMHRVKELAAYRAIFDDHELAELIDLSGSRSKLLRFEAEIAGGAWIGANKRFPVGSVHYKNITNNAPFGVFIGLEPNLDGLVHSSRLPADFRTNDVFQRGGKVRVSVLNVDRVERRVELDWVHD
jgi:transcriptional accessory protein Tex/SPT6